MEILREYSQLVRQTNKVLSFDISETPMLDEMKDYDLEYIANHSNRCDELKQVGDLSQLIFQLNDFSNAVVNYIKIFLHMGWYDAVKAFIANVFVGHIGNANYQSRLKQYNIEERLFDRFIEVVKIGKISTELYLPLILEAIFNENSYLYAWKDIAMEYMQNFMRDNDDDLDEFLVANQNYELKYLTLLLEFNTQKAISILFNKKIHEKLSENNADLFLKKYISDTVNFFDKNLPNDEELRFHYIKILANIKNNVEVETRLENIYDNERNEEIKVFLAKRLGITEALNFGTDKHFKVLALKKVDVPQERTLGVAFDNLPLMFIDGSQANNIEKTYLINILKEEKELLNLYSLTSLYQVFDKESLHSFAQILFNKHSKCDDINSAKWCVRLFSLFSSDLFEREVFEFLYALYRVGRRKEGLYLTECLIYSHKENFAEMFPRLKEFNVFNERYEDYIELYADLLNKECEEVKDLTLKMELDENEIQEEKKRLYLNFISGRKYSKKTFRRLFVYNKTYNAFAQGIVFGEYKQGKLYSIFIVRGQDLVYIYGSTFGNSDLDYYISIVHSLDLDERFQNIDLKLPNATFEQFKKNVFNIDTYNKANMAITNFYGTMVNGEEFVKNMRQKGFVPNVYDGEVQFSGLVNSNRILNILCEIEFEKSITTISQVASIGNIRFYRLSECMKDKDKYIINKSQSLSLGGVNERYFDYVISSIQSSKQ